MTFADPSERTKALQDVPRRLEWDRNMLKGPTLAERRRAQREVDDGLRRRQQHLRLASSTEEERFRDSGSGNQLGVVPSDLDFGFTMRRQDARRRAAARGDIAKGGFKSKSAPQRSPSKRKPNAIAMGYSSSKFGSEAGRLGQSTVDLHNFELDASFGPGASSSQMNSPMNSSGFLTEGEQSWSQDRAEETALRSPGALMPPPRFRPKTPEQHEAVAAGLRQYGIMRRMQHGELGASFAEDRYDGELKQLRQTAQLPPTRAQRDATAEEKVAEAETAELDALVPEELVYVDGLGHEEQLESAGIEAPKDDERHFHRGMTEAEIIARLERDANRPSPGELQLDLVEDVLTGVKGVYFPPSRRDRTSGASEPLPYIRRKAGTSFLYCKGQTSAYRERYQRQLQMMTTLRRRCVLTTAELGKLQSKMIELSQATGGNPEIGFAVFLEVMASVGVGSSDTELDFFARLFRHFDADASKTVDFDELVVGLSTLLTGTIREKLEMFWEMYMHKITSCEHQKYAIFKLITSLVHNYGGTDPPDIDELDHAFEAEVKLTEMNHKGQLLSFQQFFSVFVRMPLAAAVTSNVRSRSLSLGAGKEALDKKAKRTKAAGKGGQPSSRGMRGGAATAKGRRLGEGQHAATINPKSHRLRSESYDEMQNEQRDADRQAVADASNNRIRQSWDEEREELEGKATRQRAVSKAALYQPSARARSLTRHQSEDKKAESMEKRAQEKRAAQGGGKEEGLPEGLRSTYTYVPQGYVPLTINPHNPAILEAPDPVGDAIK